MFWLEDISDLEQHNHFCECAECFSERIDQVVEREKEEGH